MYRPMLCILYIHSTHDVKRLCWTIVCDMRLNACKVICSNGRAATIIVRSGKIRRVFEGGYYFSATTF